MEPITILRWVCLTSPPRQPSAGHQSSGFETGDATGWTNGGGGAVNIGNGCSWCDDPPRSGTNQVYWETDSEPTYYLYQTVDLSSYAGDIDAGNAVITATGWLISNEYQASPPYDECFT
jgi:hypothetical protein